MKYKAAVFFDLDHTLLNDETKVDDEVAAAIDQLRQNNVLPVIATGRSLYEIPAVLNKTKINTIVSANGSYVVLDGSPIYVHNLERTLCTQLVETAESVGDAIAVLNYQDYRINRVTDVAIKNYKYINEALPKVGVREFIEKRDVQMMIVYNTAADDRYSRFSETLSFYHNTPYSFDVIGRENSKRDGIAKILHRAQLSKLPTYAFGDGPNDISMLKYVDHPVVMENGSDAVKQYAEYVTSRNVDHGIIRGLQHYKLI